MAPEPGNPLDVPPTLSRKACFFYWIAIYLAGYLATLGVVYAEEGFPPSIPIRGCLFLLVFYAPLGLSNATLYLAGDPNGVTIQWIVGLLYLAFLPAHLILTLVFRSKWKFQCLIIILIAALIISWIGDIKVDGWRFTRSNGFHQLTPEQIERLNKSPTQK